MPPAVEAQSLNHWVIWEIPTILYKVFHDLHIFLLSSLLISQKPGLCQSLEYAKHTCSRDFTLMVALLGVLSP